MNAIADDPPTLRFVIAWLALAFLFVCVAAKTNLAETIGFRGRVVDGFMEPSQPTLSITQKY